MQVLYYSQTIWSNTDFYRTTGVLPFINHPDIILRDISGFGHIAQWDLQGADALIIQRPCTPDHLELIKLANKVGLKIILDFDDDVLNVDQFNPTFQQYREQRYLILEMLDKADEVWVSTQQIADSFGKGAVIQNAFNNYLFRKPAVFNSSKNIVWRGGMSHEADIYANSDKLVAFINGNTDHDFYFIGHRFIHLEQRCGSNYYAVEPMPLMQYADFLYQLKPKLMLFPLCDTKLNRAKSNISWLEASYSGSAFAGNVNMPNFIKEFTLDIDELLNIGKVHGDAMLEYYQRQSMAYIEANLKLSDVNELRVDSLLRFKK